MNRRFAPFVDASGRLRRLHRRGGAVDSRALATLATIFAVYVINTATAFTVHDERLQAEALARAAIELTAYQVSCQRRARPPRGTFMFRMGSAKVECGVQLGGRAHRSQRRAEGMLSRACSSGSARNADAGRQYRRPHHRLAHPARPENPETKRPHSIAPPASPMARAARRSSMSASWGSSSAFRERWSSARCPSSPSTAGSRRSISLDAAPQVIAAFPEMAPDALAAQ